MYALVSLATIFSHTYSFIVYANISYLQYSNVSFTIGSSSYKFTVKRETLAGVNIGDSKPNHVWRNKLWRIQTQSVAMKMLISVETGSLLLTWIN